MSVGVDGDGEALQQDALDLDKIGQWAQRAIAANPYRTAEEAWDEMGMSGEVRFAAAENAKMVQRLVAEVERLTVERDRARDVAVALEQQNAEALRIAREALPMTKYAGEDALDKADALRRVVRILGDDETENQ